MKFNYMFKVGDTVIETNTGELLTIAKRIGNGEIPQYKVNENSYLFPETILAPIVKNENKTIEAEEYKEEYKKEEEKNMNKEKELRKEMLIDNLKEIDNRNKELSKCARNLNLLVLKEKISSAYGREKEIEEIQQLLLRRTKPNIILTGRAGSGKTAIIEELARTFVNKAIDTGEEMPIIYDFSLNSLISGARYRGDFEEKITNLLEKISNNKNIILFIDEIHMMNDLGRSADNSISFGQILKPMLARGEIRVIGATTTEEYNSTIAKDKALKRRFSTIEVFEIKDKKDCAEKILNEYSSYFNIRTKNIIVDNILNVIDNTMKDTVFPDNFINVIDETLARVKFKKKEEITPTEINETLSRLTGMLII